jgi:hypothetical protein
VHSTAQVLNTCDVHLAVVIDHADNGEVHIQIFPLLNRERNSQIHSEIAMAAQHLNYDQ